MKTSRMRVLDYIKKQRVVSASNLSLALNMTGANARHHLALLKEQGLIEIVGERKPKGKGRPHLLYGVAEISLGHNLDLLAGALLDVIKSSFPIEVQQNFLQQTALHISKNLLLELDFEAKQDKGSRLSQRLYEVVQILNKLHYQARWEAHIDAPHLILGYCPYAAILPEHPELCQFDKTLLESLSGTIMKQTAKLATDARGSKYCLFHIGTQ